MAELDWARLFASAARDIAGTNGTAETLTKIAAFATAVAGCQWAAVARATDDTPVVVATSDPSTGGFIAKIQASGGGGPTWEAVRTGQTIEVPDLAVETRWPQHAAELLANTPVRCVLAISLRLDGEPLGALTLYSDQPDAFPPGVKQLVSVYADHAAVALDSDRSDNRADNLEAALLNSREIGTAIGILVERHKITTAQAFDLLRVASQHTHRKVRDVASDLVHTGELPTDHHQ